MPHPAFGWTKMPPPLFYPARERKVPGCCRNLGHRGKRRWSFVVGPKPRTCRRSSPKTTEKLAVGHPPQCDVIPNGFSREEPAFVCSALAPAKNLGSKPTTNDPTTADRRPRTGFSPGPPNTADSAPPPPETPARTPSNTPHPPETQNNPAATAPAAPTAGPAAPPASPTPLPAPANRSSENPPSPPNAPIPPPAAHAAPGYPDHGRKKSPAGRPPGRRTSA